MAAMRSGRSSTTFRAAVTAPIPAQARRASAGRWQDALFRQVTRLFAALAEAGVTTMHVAVPPGEVLALDELHREKAIAGVIAGLMAFVAVKIVQARRAPVVTHMVWYKVGAADETSGQSGIAHFLEHLMFKGTPTRGRGEISRLIELNGGRDNAFTTKDLTGYYVSIAADGQTMIYENGVLLAESERFPKGERRSVAAKSRGRSSAGHCRTFSISSYCLSTGLDGGT